MSLIKAIQDIIYKKTAQKNYKDSISINSLEDADEDLGFDENYYQKDLKNEEITLEDYYVFHVKNLKNDEGLLQDIYDE